MDALNEELVFLLLQFLEEEKFDDALHILERESGFFFNLKYFEGLIRDGNWDAAEVCLSGFTNIDENRYSTKIYFEIRKQKYLEALDKHDRAGAVEVLVKELKFVASFNEDLYKEITNLVTLENFRENEQLSRYGDIKVGRATMQAELRKLVQANPVLKDKLQFPSLQNARLRYLLNQSLNWQHQLCKIQRPYPEIKTLLVDHTCGEQNDALFPSPTNIPYGGSLPKAVTLPISPHPPCQAALGPITAQPAGWISNPFMITQVAFPGATNGFGASATPASSLKHHRRTPSSNNLGGDNPSANSEHTEKIRLSDEVSHGQNFHSSYDLPNTVVQTLSLGSAPTSMDFHPINHTVLLAATKVGKIELWEVGLLKRLFSRTFNSWKAIDSSLVLQKQTNLMKDPIVSVNRIIWSPDGSFFGVAFSKNVVQIFSYHGQDDIREHLEIDAHTGSVNDLAFSTHKEQQYVITCGNDHTVKVWDATSGQIQFTFEGHEAPVCSVCPQQKQDLQYILSAASDAKMNAWLYDNLGSRGTFDAPSGFSSMAYSTDGSRFFFCGSQKNVPYIMEWDHTHGTVKRTYAGFRKQSMGVVHFDTTRNKFLAAGNDCMIKFWDMDDIKLLFTLDAEGSLPECPRIRFNKDGTLLAVSASENKIKILANTNGQKLVGASDIRSFGASRGDLQAAPETGINTTTGTCRAAVTIPRTVNNVESGNQSKSSFTDETTRKFRSWGLVEIKDSSRCRTLKLPDILRPIKICRLMYIKSGMSILALASDANHLIWNWHKNDGNSDGMATADILPEQPPGGIIMTNEVADKNPEEAVHCLALSKNESYAMSASGGKISLYNMMTFKEMAKYTDPPPAATILAFHPRDNNFVAIGMDDFTILIFDVQIAKPTYILQGHTRKITGLAFSSVLNVLISSAADNKIKAWGIDQEWASLGTTSCMRIPAGRTPSALLEPWLEFHQDQLQLMVAHKFQIAIFEATKLEPRKQWTRPESWATISHSIFSCDGQLVYASFLDATICVFSSVNLKLLCRISPATYIRANMSSNVYPLVIAAHPKLPNQFAIGMTDGGVHLFEPLKSEGEWGPTPPVAENGLTGSMPTAPAARGAGSKDQHRRR